MAKITLTDVATLDSIIGAININNGLLEAAIEKTLSRDGTAPNTMSADFDMNGNQILNLPEAVDPTDPIRLGDLEDTVEEIVDEYITTNPDLEGPPGADGRTFIYRGAYSGVTAYVVDDVVTDNGSSWINILASTGNAPPSLPTTSNTWWSLISAKGTDGLGTGDLVGPAGSTDNRLPRYSGTTGKLVDQSTILVDDSGNTSGIGTLTTTGIISATSAAITTTGNMSCTNVEIGNTTDTTLSRSAAGRLAVESKDALLKGQTDDLSTAGYTSTSVDQGTKSSGTFTPAYASGSVQHATNGGAHTLAPPSGNGTMILDITNNGSAGTITVSGWTKVVGTFATTNALKYRCFISTGNAGSLLTIQAMQ